MLGAETRSSLEINYEKAAAEAINRVKQDLATKEIEKRLKTGNRNTKDERDTGDDEAKTRDRRKPDGQG